MRCQEYTPDRAGGRYAIVDQLLFDLPMTQSSPDVVFLPLKNRCNLVVEIKQKQKAGAALQSSCDLSLNELKRDMTCGAVWLKRSRVKTRRIRKASLMLTPGDRVFLYYDRALLRQSIEQPVNLVNRVNYSLWYKPPGMLTQGTKFGDHLSLLRIAEQTLNSGVVHVINP